MDVRNISQYAIFVHQHKHVYPECAEPYGLHSIKVAPNAGPGVLDTRGFIIKDTLMKGLSREGLPCHEASEDEVMGYDKGIGECIDRKCVCLTRIKILIRTIYGCRRSGERNKLLIAMDHQKQQFG